MEDTDEDIEKTENLPEDPKTTVEEKEKKDAEEKVEQAPVEENRRRRNSSRSSYAEEGGRSAGEDDEDGEEEKKHKKRSHSRKRSSGKKKRSSDAEKPSESEKTESEDEEDAGVKFGPRHFDEVYRTYGDEFDEAWGEEEDGGEAEEEEDEEKEVIIHYNTEDYISGPIRVPRGTVPMNILEFHHSFAYDCQRHFNLCVADRDTIIFASGNLINFFNVPENKIWFRRGSTGCGIGHIVKNPELPHIAVGENGIDPPIIIYEWPSMDIVTILFEGTKRSYSHLAYSPDGLLLVSQGGEPDYMITVWNWVKSRIMLRCKSHGQDVFNVMFSPTVSGHLTSSGSGHIKFWKMARTFTGLKLKGELGRFGKTEISDIVGVYPMPDEKVVSGCEWGDILIWDEGLIKLEVCRKTRKTCHTKLITQFEYSNGELMSIGMDGLICVWFYETIDLADPPDDDRFLEIEPIYQFHISEEGADGDQSMLMCIGKQVPNDPEETFWYAQDANGGLWHIDLCTFHKRQPSKKIFTCHAGPIADMDVAEWGPFVATCGKDGRLHMYNYQDKKLLLVYVFQDVGSRIIWLPCSVEATGSTIICAFESGVVRMMTVAVRKANVSNNIKGDYIRLIQAVKPHTSSISAMALNESNSLLVTGGADATIFAFQVQPSDTYPVLVPIGYIKVPSGVTCFTWKPDHHTTVLAGCERGDCCEVELPEGPVPYTIVTYELVRCEPKYFKFQSVKSAIRRESFRSDVERKKQAKVARKREEMAQLRADNPGIEIDEDAFLMDSEEDPALPEIFIPEVPNRVLFVNYTVAGTVWLSMAGFDGGYIYEYPDPLHGKHMTEEPFRCTMVYDADDTEIRSYLFHKENKYLFLGMEHGEIRVCRVNENDHTDLSNYWILSMHDNYNGYIPKMLLSHDHKMLLTCGHDGNLFSLTINDDTPDSHVDVPEASRPLSLPVLNAEDIEEPDYPSLEQVITKAEYDRIMAAAKLKKDRLLEVLRGLAEVYGKIMDRNRNLIKSQQIPQEEFELDPRITADLNHQLKAEIELVHRKLAFKVEKSRLGLQKMMDYFVEPITCLPFAVRRILKPDTSVQSLRERKLDERYFAAYTEVKHRIDERDKAGRMADEKTAEAVEEDEELKKVHGIESFLKGLSPSTIQYRLGVKINQMLRKYRARKARFDERQREWKIMYACKPDPNVNHPQDAIAIAHSRNTIGDYKLKSSANFSLPKEERETTLTKYKQFLDCRGRAHELREDFNTKLRAVRTKKEELVNEVVNLVMTLKKIHDEIPEKRVKPVPVIPQFDYNVEFPEKNLEIEKYTSMAERVKEAKRKKKSFVMEIVLDPTDEEYEVLLADDRSIHLDREGSFTSMFTSMPEKKYKSQSSVNMEILQNLTASDRIETPWEREMKRARVSRKVFEQDCILEHINTSYENLDKELDILERERLEIVADSVYMDLFLLTLHQELIILKDFEAMEDVLRAKVYEKREERDAAKQKIQTQVVRMEQKHKEIIKLQDKIKELLTTFMSMINENKFHDFLRRIYKKKYKPPKADDESSSSSSSSSDSSSEEDDAGSIDSRDIGPIHLDENICPIGCDNEIYLTAFAMREKRYEYEGQIKDEQKAIELLRKESESDSKKMKIIENSLKSNKEELEAFVREKQRKLNDIDMTVILKMHQLQHFKDATTVEKIRNCVVIDKTKLSSLYARVGELERETMEQKAKHKKNRTHLHRMNVDCKHMQDEIRHLTEDIKHEMIKKFGQEVSLDALYEAVLRRMIYDIKASLATMIKVFNEQIRCVKDKYGEELKILENLIQDNTEKLSFLTVLEEEQTKLQKILRHVPVSEEEMMQIEKEYRADLVKLENILKSQMEQMELFRNEIKNLSLKSRPLPPICPKDKPEKKRKKKKKKDKDTLMAVIDVETGEGITIKQSEGEEEETDRDEEEEVEEEGEEEQEEEEEEEEEEEHEETKREGPEDYQDENTATMVRHLLSRIIEESTGEEEGGEAARQDILREVVSNLPVGGNREDLRVGIERSVENIVATLPLDDKENVDMMRQAIREIINEIVFRLDTESKDAGLGTGALIVADEIRKTVDELVQGVGLEEASGKLQDALLQLLQTGEGVDAATDHLLGNLPADADEETKAAVREHATSVLTIVAGQIKDSAQSPSGQIVPPLEGIEESERTVAESSPDSIQTRDETEEQSQEQAEPKE